MPDTITASLASLPAREKALERTVASLLPQVDRLNVFLNGYAHTPKCLLRPKIALKHGDNRLQDSAKFWWADKVEGYHFTVDDDLAYDAGYCAFMIEKIEQYGCPVSLHGKRHDRWPVKSFLSDATHHYRCLGGFKGDHPVHVPGTGVLAYHTDHVKVSVRDFLLPGMADLWFALILQAQKVGCMAIGHPASYLTYMKPPVGTTLWEKHHRRDAVQTEIANGHAWRLYAEAREERLAPQG